MKPDCDVLVVGAGPSGAVAAIVLARAGVNVRVLDRARFPRFKLCGDSVNPGAMAILDRLSLRGAVAGALPVDGMIVTGPDGTRSQGTYGAGQQGRILSRHRFDHALVNAARAAGACVEEEVLVRQPLLSDGRVHGVEVLINGRSCRLTSRLVIAADGASSRLARAVGIARHARRPRRWAVGAYFDCVGPVERAASGGCFGEMHLRHDRYIGIAPLPGGLVNACVVTADRGALQKPMQLLLDTLRSDPAFASRFADARPVTRAVCLGPLSVEASASGVPGLLLAGDAAGFIDPMTGDGLRFAMRGGELAAGAALNALERGRPDVHALHAGHTGDGEDHAHEALARARRREFASKWRFDRALRALSGSPFALGIASRAARLAPQYLERTIAYAGDVV